MTSQVELPLRKERAQLEPISSNGGRKISLFERRNFNEGRRGKRNVKFHRSGTLIVFKVVLYISFIGFLACLIRWYFLNTQRILQGGEKIWILCSSGKNIKLHIFEPTCNDFFYYMEKPIQQKQKAGTVTSLNDTTLTKVTYGKYATRVPDEVAYGIYEWFSSQ